MEGQRIALTKSSQQRREIPALAAKTLLHHCHFLMGSSRRGVKISQPAVQQGGDAHPASIDTSSFQPSGSHVAAATDTRRHPTNDFCRPAISLSSRADNPKSQTDAQRMASRKGGLSFATEVTVESIPARANSVKRTRRWQTGSLFGCQLYDFAGVKICLKTTFCPCMAAAEVASFGEFDSAPDAHKVYWCCLYCCCPPCVAYILRADVRKLFNVEGSTTADCLACLFCHGCTLCQELRFVREVAPQINVRRDAIPSAMRQSNGKLSLGDNTSNTNRRAHMFEAEKLTRIPAFVMER
eukprot:SAG31_NODE_164_length_21790_cov_26.291411_10_plen_297_part_00